MKHREIQPAESEQPHTAFTTLPCLGTDLTEKSVKLHLAPRLSGVFHGSAGHPAGRLQPLEVPSSAACPEGLPGMLAPLPTPSPRPPQLQVLQSSPGLTPGFPVLCDYVAGAGAEWSGRNELSMDSVLLTGQRAAPEKCFLPSTKERIVQQPMQSREQAGEGLELGSFPSPARHSGTHSAPPFLTSHSHHPWLLPTPAQAVPLCHALPQPSSTTSPPKVFLWLYTPWSTLTSCLVTYQS